MLFGFFLILFGLFFVFVYGVHYMIILLFLELILLGVFIFLCLGNFSPFGLQNLFLFLLVMVCMGGYGVSLLVSSTRFSGRDFGSSGFIF